MLEIVLKIPQEFEQDFNADKFKECFERVLSDCKAWDYAGLSGNYEHETIEMLLDAFNEAVVLPKGHGALKDVDSLRQDLFFHRYSDVYCEEHNIDCSISMGMLGILIGDAPTIIEADKEEK